MKWYHFVAGYELRTIPVYHDNVICLSEIDLESRL